MRPNAVRKVATAIAFSIVGALTNTLPGGDVRLDVSRLIDKAQAESILGEKVREPKPRNVEGQDGYYSKCNYYTANPRKSLVIRLHQPTPNAIGPQRELELIAATTASTQPVTGLGDKARMSSNYSDSDPGLRLLMLYVAKGNAFIVIGLSGIADESAALEKAKSVAQKIIEHL